MSVLEKLRSGERSPHSVSSILWPSSALASPSPASFLGTIGGRPAGFFGSKKPGGFGNVATSSRFMIAWPASWKPAESPARASVDRLARSAFMRSISAFWSFVMSVVNWKSTGS